MKNIKQRVDESRKDYLLRVAIEYIDVEKENRFDEAVCDGYCLIDDIKIALNIDD